MGELDEKFVYETKEGDRIILGSQTWRVVRIDADRVLVEAAAPGSSRMPFWRGESAPRPKCSATPSQSFTAKWNAASLPESEDNTLAWLLPVDHHFDDEPPKTPSLSIAAKWPKARCPTEAAIVVEHFTDRTGRRSLRFSARWAAWVNYALHRGWKGNSPAATRT